MGATYTRQEASNITDGSVIEASHLNNEYNQIEAAFAALTGHSHDGSSAEGGYVPLIADSDALNKILVDTSSNRFGIFTEVGGVATEQFRFQDGAIVPVTDNDIDLGTASLEFKNLYIDGIAYVDSISMPTTTVTDILDEDNMASNSATALATQQSIKAYVDSQVTAQDLDFIADTGGALNIDLDSETLTFTGGTGIDTSGSGNAVTFAIDSTVATLTGTQTLTNKTLTTPTIASIVNTGTLTLPTSTDTLVGRATTDTLTNKTLTSAVLNGTISGTSIKDEDDMLSNSASHLATQQSIKAYVDSQVTAQDLDFQGDSGGALSIDLDSETFTIAGGTGIDTSGSLNTLTVAIDSTVATLTGTQTLTNKTLTSPTLTTPVLNTSVSGTAFLDDDTFATASATTLASSESIKAYVDAQVATANELTELTDVTITSVADNEVLAYDSTSSKWINQTSTEAGLATLTGTETLTNKTLTTPTIASIVNTGTLTLPTSTDTLVGRATTDTLTNKSIDLTNNTLTGTTAQFNTALSDGSFATLAGTETLTNKTLTSPVLNGTLSGTAFLDEDNMASNSATAVASQQSIKAYVDSQVTAQDLDFQGDSGGALSIDLDSETFTIAGGTGIDTTGSGNTLSVAIDNTVATKGFAIAMAVAL